MEKREMEIEQVYNYIKKNPDVSASDVRRELMFSEIITTNIICYLLGANKIELHRLVGKSKLYKVVKK